MLPKFLNPSEHPLLAASVSAKGTAKPREIAESGGEAKLGTLPEWKLADLYEGTDSPKLKADLQTSERAANSMQDRYAGKLAKLLDGGNGGSGAGGSRA